MDDYHLTSLLCTQCQSAFNGPEISSDGVQLLPFLAHLRVQRCPSCGADAEKIVLLPVLIPISAADPGPKPPVTYVLRRLNGDTAHVTASDPADAVRQLGTPWELLSSVQPESRADQFTHVSWHRFAEVEEPS